MTHSGGGSSMGNWPQLPIWIFQARANRLHPQPTKRPTSSPLQLPNALVHPSNSTKYLESSSTRTHMEAQWINAIRKGSSYVSALHHLSRPHSGLAPKHIHCLYCTVALPKITYVLAYGDPIKDSLMPRQWGNGSLIRALTPHNDRHYSSSLGDSTVPRSMPWSSC